MRGGAEANDESGTRKLTDTIIKNTYRTLMTRGMKGCYVYATDPALRELMRRAVVGPDPH